MSEMTPDEMVRNYIRIRDHKERAEKEFKEGMERVNKGLKKLEASMLTHLQSTGGNSLKTDFGTVYISTKYSATVDDRDTFLDWVRGKNQWEALDVRANKTFVRTFTDETSEVVPGVKLTGMTKVNVRRS